MGSHCRSAHARVRAARPSVHGFDDASSASSSSPDLDIRRASAHVRSLTHETHAPRLSSAALHRSCTGRRVRRRQLVVAQRDKAATAGAHERHRAAGGHEARKNLRPGVRRGLQEPAGPNRNPLAAAPGALGTGVRGLVTIGIVEEEASRIVPIGVDDDWGPSWVAHRLLGRDPNKSKEIQALGVPLNSKSLEISGSIWN